MGMMGWSNVLGSDFVTAMTGGDRVEKEYTLYTDSSLIVYKPGSGKTELLSSGDLAAIQQSDPETFERIKNSLQATTNDYRNKKIYNSTQVTISEKDAIAMVPMYPMCVLVTSTRAVDLMKLVDASDIINNFYEDVDCKQPITQLLPGAPKPIYSAEALPQANEQNDGNDTISSDYKLNLAGTVHICKEGSAAHVTAKMLGNTDSSAGARIIPAPTPANRGLTIDLQEGYPLSIIPSVSGREYGFAVCTLNKDKGSLEQQTVVQGLNTYHTDNPNFSYVYYNYYGLRGICIVPGAAAHIIMKQKGITTEMDSLASKAGNMAASGVRDFFLGQKYSDATQYIFGSLLQCLGVTYLTADKKTGSIIALDAKNRQFLLQVGVQSPNGMPYQSTRNYGLQFATWIPVPGTHLGLVAYGLLEHVSVGADLRNLSQEVIQYATQYEDSIIAELVEYMYDPEDRLSSKIKNMLGGKGYSAPTQRGMEYGRNNQQQLDASFMDANPYQQNRVTQQGYYQNRGNSQTQTLDPNVIQ